MDIASHTGQFGGIEQQVQRLYASNQISRPELDYRYAKALFTGAESDVTRLTRALSLFVNVPRDDKIAPAARYYAGVTEVRLERLSNAIDYFKQAHKLASQHPQGQNYS